jgi:hypothetical protein
MSEQSRQQLEFTSTIPHSMTFKNLNKSQSSCFECKSKNASWVSLNNAIYLCINCAGVHRGFGVGVSKVKSLEFDFFTPEQLQLLNRGGNKRLNTLIEGYPHLKEMNSRERLQSMEV